MTGPKQTPSADKSLVIQKRLEGKSMNQIVRETGILKGKVQYLINDWKQKIGASSIDEITDYASLVKRSDITIEECAQEFKMINILKNLGIGDMDIADDEDDSHAINYKEFSSFIEEIYKNCIKLGVAPALLHNSIYRNS